MLRGMATGSLRGWWWIALLWGQLASAAPAPVTLELALDQPKIPEAELLGWELLVDGAPLALRPPAAGERLPTALIAPGLHVVELQVRYRRELKTVVDEGGETPVGLTFAAGGSRSVRSVASIDVKPSTTLHLAAIIDDDPDAIDDRLVLLHWDRRDARAEGDAEALRVLENFARLFSPGR